MKLIKLSIGKLIGLLRKKKDSTVLIDRSGFKGVVTEIIPDEDMPTDESGNRPEIILPDPIQRILKYCRSDEEIEMWKKHLEMARGRDKISAFIDYRNMMIPGGLRDTNNVPYKPADYDDMIKQLRSCKQTISLKPLSPTDEKECKRIKTALKDNAHRYERGCTPCIQPYDDAIKQAQKRPISADEDERKLKQLKERMKPISKEDFIKMAKEKHGLDLRPDDEEETVTISTPILTIDKLTKNKTLYTEESVGNFYAKEKWRNRTGSSAHTSFRGVKDPKDVTVEEAAQQMFNSMGIKIRMPNTPELLEFAKGTISPEQFNALLSGECLTIPTFRDFSTRKHPSTILRERLMPVGVAIYADGSQSFVAEDDMGESGADIYEHYRLDVTVEIIDRPGHEIWDWAQTWMKIIESEGNDNGKL